MQITDELVDEVTATFYYCMFGPDMVPLDDAEMQHVTSCMRMTLEHVFREENNAG